MNQRQVIIADNMAERGDIFGILLMVVSSCCVCIGQLFWKLSADGNLLYLFPGFLLYGTGFIVMIAAYKYGSVSKLQPILSLNYVFAVLLGYGVLGESISAYKLLASKPSHGSRVLSSSLRPVLAITKEPDMKPAVFLGIFAFFEEKLSATV